MHAGLITSVLMHAALLLWALFVMHSTPELKPPEPESVEIALITPSELLRLKQGDVNAKELEAKAKEEEPKPDISKKEAEKPKPITSDKPPEPTPPEPKAAETPPPEPPKTEPPPPDPIAEKLAAIPPEPAPAPGPTPEELKKVEEQKQIEEAKKKAEDDKKKAEEKKKAEDKKKADDAKKKKLAEDKKKKEAKEQADKLAALLDKDPTKRGAPQAASTPTKPTDYKGPVAGAEKGTDTVLSAREQDLLKGKLKAQLARCWNLPGGGGGTETPVVTLKWRLRVDGGLDGEPQVVNPGTGAFAGLAVESAMRAVKNCQPFTLPPDSYAAWKEIEWDFDPRQML